jgi:hypothetical protein
MKIHFGKIKFNYSRRFLRQRRASLGRRSENILTIAISGQGRAPPQAFLFGSMARTDGKEIY